MILLLILSDFLAFGENCRTKSAIKSARGSCIAYFRSVWGHDYLCRTSSFVKNQCYSYSLLIRFLVDALMILVSLLEPTRAPYLYFLLHSWAEILVLFVGLGMGAAAILGTLRFMYSWSLKAIVVPITLLAVAFSIYMTWVNPELSEVIGLSWDIGSMFVAYNFRVD